MSSTLNWHDTCQHCGGDLPLDAPSYQKFCSAECRFKAYEVYQTQSRADLYASRRQRRLDAKRDRPPCEECGTAIPIHTIASARFCSDLCQRRNHGRRRAARIREARLAERAKRRAERQADAAVLKIACQTQANHPIAQSPAASSRRCSDLKDRKAGAPAAGTAGAQN